MKKPTRLRIVAVLGLALALGVVKTAPAADGIRALTLPEAIDTALKKNPDFSIVGHRLEAARAAIRQAESSFYPQLRINESYAASDNPVQAFMMTLNQRSFTFNADFNRPAVTDNLGTKLLATYPLYNGGRDLAGRQAAKLGGESAEQIRQAVRNELVFEVTRAFYTIGTARQFAAAAEAAVASMDANAKVARERFEQGAVLKTDVLDTEVRLAEAKENQVRARHAVTLAETAFCNLLGVDDGERVTAAQQENVGASERRSVTEVLDVSKRPEWLAARKTVAAAERHVRAAQGGYLPRVNAFASYDINSAGDAERFTESWLAGVSVDVDVFDGMLTRGKVAEARANLDAAREQMRRTKLALQLEAQQAQLNVEEARERLETTGQIVARARESVELTRERYKNGMALLTQLLDAETALTAARQRRAAAEADDRIAQAALDKAFGRTWKE